MGFAMGFYMGLGQTDTRFSDLEQSFLRMFFMFVEGLLCTEDTFFRENSLDSRALIWNRKVGSRAGAGGWDWKFEGYSL